MSGKLPAPCGAGVRLLELDVAGGASAEDVAEAIEIDALLSRRLVKLVAQTHGADEPAVSTVVEAARAVGPDAARCAGIAFSVISASSRGVWRGFDYDRFWSRALARAVACSVISRRAGIGSGAESFVLGALAELGRLALARVHPEAYLELLSAHRAAPTRELVKAERARFDIDHTVMAESLLADWGFPPELIRAVGEFEFTDITAGAGALTERAQVLDAADILARVRVHEEDATLESWELSARKVAGLKARLGCDDQAFTDLCDSIVAGWHAWGEELGMSTHPSVELHGRASGNHSRHAASPSEEAGTPEDLRRLESAAVTPRAGRAIEGSGPLQVLVVDDDTTGLHLLEENLKRGGYEVRVAPDGEAALRAVVAAPPQIVVCDWQMPRMNGLELCRALRRMDGGAEIYFVLVTGHDAQATVVEAFDAGVDDYIQKPFDPRVLLARIKGGRRVIELQRQFERDQQTIQRQVAELQRLTRRLRSAALTDTLTGLPNRRFAMRRLQQAWESSTRTDQPLSIVMVDIDEFKRINDEYGHAAGDIALRQTSEVLRSVLSADEDVCRLSGDELLVICPGSDMAAAARMAEALRRAVGEQAFAWGGETVNVTLSLGVASRCRWMESSDAFLEAADEAAYAAKEGGRNRVSCASQTPPTVST
ncbi:MAG: diguanylate cyclase [Planctomycetota bacterium]|nr:diguanylate cyclase [Planctomycetota bacterium]MDP6990519.1 diguanylate cyclase [Planctomycetota bacterium]